MDCGRGSLIKLCGLRGIKFYDPHTSVDRTRCRRLPTSCLAGYPCHCKLERGGSWVQIKQLERHLMWPLWLTQNWSSCFNVLDGMAASGHRQAVYSGPFRQQKTILDIIISALHCFERKACWPMCIRDLMQQTVAANSVCDREQRTCEMCIHLPYCPTSCHGMTEKRH